MYSAKENINILTSLLRSYGVRHIVACPGSRNAPIVHNFNECPDFICHSVTDERSAGFIALGLTSALSVDDHAEPVAVCVTSGSALLNTLPAVTEATYQHRGIIVISADRPDAWINQLDGQTLPQCGALGQFVGKSVSLPEPSDETQRWHCLRLVCEAMVTWSAPSHPSVHINVPVTEPLFEFTVSELPDIRKVSLEYNAGTVAKAFVAAQRPMLVIGQMDRLAAVSDYLRKIKDNVVVLAEQLSVDFALPVDQLICAMGKDAQKYLPDYVIYIGGHTVSKRLRQFLRLMEDEANVCMVNVEGELEDVTMHATSVLQCQPMEVLEAIWGNISLLKSSEYYGLWGRLKSEICASHKSFDPEYSQLLAVKHFEKGITEKYGNANERPQIFYANSMSVRLAAIYADHYVHCNRGVNGIEGSLSVAAGASMADSRRMTFCIIGDLSFFYDQNALWNTGLGGNFRILLLNNHCGSIFKNLSGLEHSPSRDEYVSAQHGVSAEGICSQNSVIYHRVTDERSLATEILWLLDASPSDRPRLLEVVTDPDKDIEVYKEYYHLL